MTYGIKTAHYLLAGGFSVMILRRLHISDTFNYFLTRYDEYKQSMDTGYPKMIAEEFPGIGNKVDAVFQKDGK